LGYDRNAAEGLLVEGAPFVVHGQEAKLERDATAAIVNGGFEDHAGDHARGCRFHDQPGKVSFVDTAVAKEGQASLRFENFGQYPHGHSRVMFEVSVRPHRCYRVTGWVKTEDDGDTLDNPKEWLENLNRTPGAVGIMDTTWRNKYELLAPFGELVSKELPR
jgi:hypothetical protein